MAIQQRLHTKLVQKLILTPSLQQAIKLLPMSTIELADMLNQEVVENPMLEEIPTEDIRATIRSRRPSGRTAPSRCPSRPPGPRAGTTTTTPTSSATTSTTATRGSRAPVEVKELPPIENTLSTQGSLAEHLEWQLSMSTDDENDQRHRRRDHRQSRRRRLSDGVGRRDRRHGRLEARRRRARALEHPALRPGRRRRARPAGVPHAAAPAPRLRRHAGRAHRHRAPAPAPEPSGSRDRAAPRHERSRS